MSDFSGLVGWGIGSKKRKKAPTVHLGGDRCMLCGKTRAQVGRLHKAHILARSKGGRVTVTLCPKHHALYDSPKLNKSQLAKLGISETQYARFVPSRARRKKKQPASPYDFNVRLPNL